MKKEYVTPVLKQLFRVMHLILEKKVLWLAVAVPEQYHSDGQRHAGGVHTGHDAGVQRKAKPFPVVALEAHVCHEPVLALHFNALEHLHQKNFIYRE